MPLLRTMPIAFARIGNTLTPAIEIALQNLLMTFAVEPLPGQQELWRALARKTGLESYNSARGDITSNPVKKIFGSLVAGSGHFATF